MIDLNILEEAAQQQSIQQAQQSSIAQKAAESAQQPDHYPEDVQGILDEIKAAQERDAIRRRIAVYNYACGGNMHASGGGIHIDPSKRGTFTAAASRHGMGVQAFASKVLANKDNYSPAMVKKANFARNAAKFHHAYGGNLYGRGGTISHQEGRIKNILDKYLSDYRITSAYRGKNNKVGKLGSKSAHAHLLDDGSSAALDIVSNDMNRLRQELANPMLQKELVAAGFSILDETDPATMRRTGATGAHFHIGQGIKGGGFQLNGYGYQPADAYAQDMQFQPIDMSSSPQQQAIGPWWTQNAVPVASQDLAYAEPEIATQTEELIPSFKLDWNLNVPSYPNLFAKGGNVSKAKPLYDELIAANIPHNLAIGPVSNIIAESSVNPNAKNSVNGGHFGYLQNDRNITNHIKKYYGGYGHAEQMQFLKDGLTGHIRGAAQAPWLQRRFDDYKRHMRGVTDPSQAALIWERDYEKSANEALGKRAEYARQLNAMLGNPSAGYTASAGNPSVDYAMLPSVDMSASNAVAIAAPWWISQQNLGYPAQPVEAEVVQQANPFMPTVKMFDLGWDPMNGRHDSGTTYPKLFADGGPYNDAFMDYYGYSWVPGNQIYVSDPYFRQIQEHNSDGVYAVDSDGYYVPASTMKSNWDFYNENGDNLSMNTPATAYPLPEVAYTMQDSDLAAVDAANRMFGDNRNLVYEDLWNRGSASASSILNKLDTLSANSAYMTLNTYPDYIAELKRKPYKVKSDGTLRAQYNTKTNTATIEPVPGHFFEPYISEFVHGFQYNNNVPGIDLVGYNPRAITTNRKAVDAAYNDPESNEYKAHRVLQPIMNNYLNNPSMGYDQFIAALKTSQRAALANR